MIAAFRREATLSCLHANVASWWWNITSHTHKRASERYNSSIGFFPADTVVRAWGGLSGSGVYDSKKKSLDTDEVRGGRTTNRCAREARPRAACAMMTSSRSTIKRLTVVRLSPLDQNNAPPPFCFCSMVLLLY
jgi:hypothetical protein